MKLLEIKKIAITATFLAGNLIALNANSQSVTQTIGGVTYTITLSSSSTYNSISSTLQASSIWGDASLANALAISVGKTSALGAPNNGAGPAFAYGVNSVNGNVRFYIDTPGGVFNSSAINSASFYWALVAGGGSASGPSVANTQASLQITAGALQGIYTLQNAVIANSFSYDCDTFGANNVCVSAGGRNTAVSATNGLNNTSGLLIAAYRPHANYRIGAYADQNLSVNNAGSTVNLGNNTPLIGIFGAWNERLDGTGAEVKVSAAYGQKNTTITRQVIGTSEAGSGSSQLNSQGAQVAVKYGFGVATNTIVSPYVGIRYTQNNMGGYTEGASGSVTAPLTYSALNTNATTALAGIGASYRGIPKTNLFASAGIESDTNTSAGSYSATGVSGLVPVNFNANPVKNRATATVGATYDVEKNQRLGVTGIYRQESYQAVSTTTVMATYTVGF